MIGWRELTIGGEFCGIHSTMSGDAIHVPIVATDFVSNQTIFSIKAITQVYLQLVIER